VRQKGIIIPSWLWSQVNKEGQKEGEFLTSRQVLENNLMSAIDEFYKAHPNDSDNMVLVCAKERIPSGDFRYGIACVPVDNNDADIINFELNGFKKIPTLFLNAKKEVIKTVTRILGNLAFA
jgi:hypothetical protein